MDKIDNNPGDMMVQNLKSGLNQIQVKAISTKNPDVFTDWFYVDVIYSEGVSGTVVAVNGVSNGITNNGVATLYELTVYINCGNNTIVAKVVIAGGVRSLLSVDAKEMGNASAVRSIRISLKRITGVGDCNLKLYGMSLNSETFNDEDLEKSFGSIRDYLRSDTIVEDSNRTRQVIVIVVLLSSVALVSVLFAFANDRRLAKNIDQDIRNFKNRKRE